MSGQIRRGPGRHGLVAVAVVAMALATVIPLAVGSAAAASAQGRHVHGAAAPATRPSRRDPKKSVPPSSAFSQACFNVTGKTASQRACEKAALPDFDRVRSSEGMARMSLPTKFPSMSAPHQLLVLVNIERADRGLKVFPGLSKRLDGYAAKGARAGTDPPFPQPFPGDFGGGNWAGVGTSTLLADYVWMYDDGRNSPNEDCTSSDHGGCWGHRHNIIRVYDGPREMGAAVARHGQSMTQEFIGGDHTDHASAPKWTKLAGSLPIGVSRTRPTVHAPVGGAGNVRLSVWASGEAMHVHAKLRGTSRIWSLSRSSCRLAAGTKCRITVTAKPTSAAIHHATVTLTGPNGSRVVHLTERPTR